MAHTRDFSDLMNKNESQINDVLFLEDISGSVVENAIIDFKHFMKNLLSVDAGDQVGYCCKFPMILVNTTLTKDVALTLVTISR